VYLTTPYLSGHATQNRKDRHPHRATARQKDWRLAQPTTGTAEPQCCVVRMIEEFLQHDSPSSDSF